MNLFDLFVKIGVQDNASGPVKNLTSNLKGGLVSAAKLGTNAVAGTANVIGKGLVSACKLGIGALTTASAALVALGKIGFDYNSQMEMYTTNFEVMLGDSAKAVRQVEQLKELAASTPFEMTDLASATQTLLAFNVSSKDTTDVLRRLGDISLGDTQKLASLTRAFGKMNASQKVALEDINMMIDAGFNPLLIIADEMGITMTEVYDKVSKGEISFEQMTAAIDKATSAGGQFYQGMEKASKTTNGLISTLVDNAKALVGQVFEPMSKSLQGTILPSLISGVEKLSEAFERDGAEGLIDEFASMLGKILKVGVEKLPEFARLGTKFFTSILKGFSENSEDLGKALLELATAFAEFISEFTPQLIDLGVQVLEGFLEGFSKNPDKIVRSVSKMFVTILDTINAFFDTILGVGEDVTGGIVEGFDFKTISKGIAQVVLNIVKTIIKALPDIIEAGADILMGLIQGITENMDSLLSTIVSVIEKIGEWLEENGDLLIDSVVALIDAIAEGIEKYLPLLTEAVTKIIVHIIELLTREDLMNSLIAAVLTIVTVFIEQLETVLPAVIEIIFMLIEAIVNALLEPENLAKLIEAAARIVIAIIAGLIGMIPKLIEGVVSLIASIFDTFRDTDWGEIGKEMIDGILGGLKRAWKKIKGFFKDAWKGIKGIFTGEEEEEEEPEPKKSSNSTRTATARQNRNSSGATTSSNATDLYYGYLAQLTAASATTKPQSRPASEPTNAMDIYSSILADVQGGTGTVLGSTETNAGTSIDSVTINVNVAETNASPEDIAEQVAIAMQNLIDRKGAVYA